ncbi:MAG: hypothetical protein JSS11_06245 [Verrucomicrobia bacterium]|nr:hypothetical protein [Verrucomicrobiota bacterium]
MLRYPVCLRPLRIAVLLFSLMAMVPESGATTVLAPEFPKLVSGSDCIVRAVVKNVTSVKKSRGAGRSAKIFTEVELTVTEVIAGNPPANLTLELLGGKVGEQELTVEGMPQFHVGDEDILFVSGNGKNISPLYGMMHGRYPILKDATGRRYVARSDGEPLRTTAQISTPMAEGTADTRSAQATASALTPEDFIAQIKAAPQLTTPAPRAN